MKPQDFKPKTIDAGNTGIEEPVVGATDNVIYYILSTTVEQIFEGTSYHKSLVLGYYFNDRDKARVLARSLAGGPDARSVKGLDDWYESKPEMVDGTEHYTIYQVKQLKAWEDGMAALVL